LLGNHAIECDATNNMADARVRQRHGKHHVTCYENDATVGAAMFPCYISELHSGEQSVSSVSESVADGSEGEQVQRCWKTGNE
jgi:hypothetical protein